MHEITVPAFDRYGDDLSRITRIGDGGVGGKAAGLARAEPILDGARLPEQPELKWQVPRLVILCIDLFVDFLRQNRLEDVVADESLDDEEIALAFQRSVFPAEHTGDLRALSQSLRTPLAVRSSSLLEDAIYRPFAGVYATKMIPNNQPGEDTRFRRLVEAIKYVYASTYFSAARRYRRSIAVDDDQEQMAVIVQEIAGRRYRDRFYPQISGVARSFNYYPFEPAKPQDGVVNLALGLGKTIVDGGVTYTYSPAHPKLPPPHGSVGDLLDDSQTRFWAVNMGPPPEYDPIRETEYLVDNSFTVAESDECLDWLVSTYDAGSDRLVPGTYKRGPRVLNFAPILQEEEAPLNDLIRRVLDCCEEALHAPVEVEFAANFGPERGHIDLAFLQVRPMVVSTDEVDVTDDDRSSPDLLVYSERVLGNGESHDLRDIVYVKADEFDPAQTRAVAREVAQMNAALVERGTPYLLVGFGRWGSSDPWLGVPVQWSDIAGARAIVEATISGMTPDFSQGSHFFHNLSSFEVSYFFLRHTSDHRIDWDWLARLPSVAETRFVRHVRAPAPLTLKVDGRSGRGIIVR